jgi:hypothetical protein
VNGLELTEALVALLVAVAAAPPGRIQEYGATRNSIYLGPGQAQGGLGQGSTAAGANKQPRLNDFTSSPYPTGTGTGSNSNSHTGHGSGLGEGPGPGEGLCSNLWEAVLGVQGQGQGAVGDGFTTDVCALLRLLGEIFSRDIDIFS